jgi:hypothetical protein
MPKLDESHDGITMANPKRLRIVKVIALKAIFRHRRLSTFAPQKGRATRMAKSSVSHIRKAFIAEIIRAQNLVHSVRDLPRRGPKSIDEVIHPKHVNQIIELAFMGMVSAWEEFLEATLVRYMTGATTEKGYSPTPKFGQAKDLAHAYEILSNDPDYKKTKSFLKVTEPRSIWRLADFFFSKHNFKALDSKAPIIRHASAIRNRVAHSSEKCRKEFKITALEFLRPSDGKLVSGYQPGKLLTTPVQRIFSQSSISKGTSHFDAFAELYEELARIIVPD